MIDFNTATMGEVIRRSCLMHPTLFAEAMQHARDVHLGFARVTRDSVAYRTASDMTRDLDNMIQKALRASGAIDPAEMTDGQRIQVFAIAARLQSVSPALQADIAARG